MVNKLSTTEVVFFRSERILKCYSSVTHSGIDKLLQEIYSPFSAPIVSPIIALMKKNTPFVWIVACQTALDTIKHAITNSTILIYPDPSKECHLFMDASNHTLSSVLTEKKYNSETNGNKEHTYHPITYQSGTFSTSQLKWSTIVKE